MQKSLHTLAAAGCVASVLCATIPAMAIDWVSSEGTMTFRSTHRTTAVAADFNNSDLLDIYYGGQLANDYPGYEWQIQSNLYYNNGDGSFTVDGASYNGSGIDLPKHGIPGSGYNTLAAIDFNNDGFVDLITVNRGGDWDVLGYSDYVCRVVLMKNNGDGTFSLVSTLPTPKLDGSKNGDFANYHSIATGDYDRDGYTDILLSFHAESGPFVGLYHNNGDGSFSCVDNLVEEYVVNASGLRVKDFVTHNGTPTQNFMQCSGNVWFADLNNDGWLDVIVDGAESHTHSVRGNQRMVYINNADNGAELPFTGYVNHISSLRKAESKPIDVDGDGYLDFFAMGYDNGWTSAILPNHWVATDHMLPFGVAADNVDKIGGIEIALPGDENCRPLVFDFSGNARYDVFFNNKGQGLHEASAADGWSFAQGNAPYGGLDTGVGIAADFNNDGLLDVFGLGYGHGPHIYYNTDAGYVASAVARVAGSRAASVSLEAPENVSVAVNDGAIHVEWDGVSGDAARGLGYNVFVKQGDNIVSVLPANPTTGFVKVGAERVTALRPGVNEYTISGDAINTSKSFTVGVQTVSVADGTNSSQFATAEHKAVTTGVDEIQEEFAAGAWLSQAPGSITVNVPGADIAVSVTDMAGRTIATGRTNAPVAITAKGVLIVATANGSFVSKIVR